MSFYEQSFKQRTFSQLTYTYNSTLQFLLKYILERFKLMIVAKAVTLLEPHGPRAFLCFFHRIHSTAIQIKLFTHITAMVQI
jgi:hypothetical protein